MTDHICDQCHQTYFVTTDGYDGLCLACAKKAKSVKRSDIYLAAWMAAENALPAESLALIKAYNHAHDAWRKAGYGPIPPEVNVANHRVESDPLAKIAFSFRVQCNQAHHEEWAAEEAAKSKPAATVVGAPMQEAA